MQEPSRWDPLPLWDNDYYARCPVQVVFHVTCTGCGRSIGHWAYVEPGEPCPHGHMPDGWVTRERQPYCAPCAAAGQSQALAARREEVYY